MIPYSRPKLSDLCTLLEKHTLHSGTYLYSPYMVVPPPPPFRAQYPETEVALARFRDTVQLKFTPITRMPSPD